MRLFGLGILMSSAERAKLVITQQYDEQAAGIFTYTGTATEMVILSATFWLPTCLHIFLILMCEFYKPCPQGTDFKKDFDANSYQGCEPVKAFLFKNFVLKPGSHGPITSLCQLLTVFFCNGLFLTVHRDVQQVYWHPGQNAQHFSLPSSLLFKTWYSLERPALPALRT
mmetsp:Transcript_83183/g.121802  ORF Transcript_83183/g.121802 Transcript_83183/m.121802 type:complete len:169 (+) Transcript_83183:152-658(+)